MNARKYYNLKCAVDGRNYNVFTRPRTVDLEDYAKALGGKFIFAKITATNQPAIGTIGIIQIEVSGYPSFVHSKFQRVEFLDYIESKGSGIGGEIWQIIENDTI